ncbi:DUF4430 domain-containing protein [Archaeoglobus profundus]|uniref:Prenyltransferase/squalene oxidase n=1 Tax=Archaeoglobus profundus (strain DSM 5631 / JCM 9629 / NBRC 100127 / Av18) TaxID=572546 RepID=D2RGE5_ARCPA|nr:prenyltransferase/squalene oxidase repeat-containing protein [Archaeoglobus profundus]ADB57370.1 Prenyltransferase/squalene oxidase [Archaeoglobus profundus DSM 5631]
MKKVILVLFVILTVQTAQALTINVQGDFIVGHKLTISTDKPALIILRMNNGTPIYANTSTNFTPQVAGMLTIEAIAGCERASKVIEIRQPATSSMGSSGWIGRYYLPSGTTTITLEDGGSATINWRTALGVLIKASQERGFSVKIKKWSYGLFVDCIGGICTRALGETSGWVYQVNGETPMVSSEQYNLNAGDTVVWYFSRSMSEAPESSPYRITIKTYDDWSFDVSINPAMPWSLPSEETGSSSVSTTPTPTPTIPSKMSVARTNNSITCTVVGNVTVEVNVTKIPLKVSVRSAKAVLLKISKYEPKGLEFNEIYATPLDCFDLELNRSTNVTISFVIPKEKLTKLDAKPEDVCIAEYEGKWKFIPTNYTENETYYTFTANLTSFSIFAIVAKWESFPLNSSDERIVKALNWLKSQQRPDGGWGSLSNTSWVVMAIASANENPCDWIKNGKSPLDYFKANLNESVIERMGTSDFARTILALIALNQNPYNFNGINFVEKLKERVKEDGQIGDYIYTTIWGILALKACGENVSKSVEWLKAHQNPDGGFAWAVNAESDFDDTASAIQALIASGVSRDDPVIKKALNYLKKGQCEDGGMRYFGNSSSNADSDAWTIQALVSACVNPTNWKTSKSVVEHLLSLQAEDGHFKYTKYVTSIPIKVTADSVMALLGKPHPVKILLNRTTQVTANRTVAVTTEVTYVTYTTITPTPTTITKTVASTTTIATTNPPKVTATTKKVYGFEAILGILALLFVMFYRRS